MSFRSIAARPVRALRIHLVGLLVTFMCMGVAADARADVADDVPTTVVSVKKEESAPFWVWLLPPAGLIIGLTAGARLRARHNRSKPKA